MSDPASSPRRWVIDGNNVFGSRPDGWWNDRGAAQARFAQRVAEWCRTHDDEVTVVFDPPVTAATAELAGGNFHIVEARRRGRDAADDEIVDLVSPGRADGAELTVVTSDRGLRGRLPSSATVWGAGRFLRLIEGDGR
jgi:predicted RNA-binding protein with PIN domain